MNEQKDTSNDNNQSDTNMDTDIGTNTKVSAETLKAEAVKFYELSKLYKKERFSRDETAEVIK